MKFLEKFDFTKEDIDEFINNTPKKVLETLKKHKSLIEKNLAFLQSLGAKTYREIFINYPDLFFLDASVFEHLFNRYEKDSLLEKLNENFKIIEYL